MQKISYSKTVTIINIISLFKVTTRNFQVLLKKSHDSSDDDEFPVTANKTLSQKNAIFMSL